MISQTVSPIKVGITACSNPHPVSFRPELAALQQTLRDLGQESVCSPYLFSDECGLSGSGTERGDALMQLFNDPGMRNIYDISGGDMANEVLIHLNYNEILKSSATFWGYSDLTTVINAIYTQTGKPSVLYQIRNLIGENASLQQARFRNEEELFHFSYDFLQGTSMSGTVVGGNIRCFLKLAGTPYFPDLNGKILLLEALGGRIPQMITYLSQLEQLGAFRAVNGILLGTFTTMERHGYVPDMPTLVRNFAGPQVPIAKTAEIGHGSDARAIRIGSYYELC